MKLKNGLFKVKRRDIEKIYTVYDVKDENGYILFLIYDYFNSLEWSYISSYLFKEITSKEEKI